jgi:RNA polymerase sigma-70 factor, ECF subfamily
VTYDTAELEGTLAALYARGRAAHPRLAVGEDAFGRFLARSIDGKAPMPLDRLAVEDLYLACACAGRVRGAEAAFEAEFAPAIRRVVARVVVAPDDRQDAEQRVRQHLLVGERGAGPAIAKYPGRGPLAKWIPVVAIRVALSLNRSESVERRLRDKAGAEAMGVNPEHLYMKAELRNALEPAVGKALGRLADRDRLILRLYLIAGMTLQAIAQSLGVTQQAVSKRLAGARKALLDDIREGVAARLKIPKDELSSVMRFVASQLDVNISRVLRAK